MAARKKQTTTVAVELEQIYERYNGLDPKRVVSWAKSRPSSALHQRFEWNDGKAAHEYRLWQAREIITEVVVEYEDGAKRQLYVSPVQLRGNRGYARLVDVLDDEELRTSFLQEAFAAYERVGEKYRDLEELAGVRKAVGEAKRRTKRRKSRRAA